MTFTPGAGQHVVSGCDDRSNAVASVLKGLREGGVEPSSVMSDLKGSMQKWVLL